MRYVCIVPPPPVFQNSKADRRCMQRHINNMTLEPPKTSYRQCAKPRALSLCRDVTSEKRASRVAEEETKFPCRGGMNIKGTSCLKSNAPCVPRSSRSCCNCRAGDVKKKKKMKGIPCESELMFSEGRTTRASRFGFVSCQNSVRTRDIKMS